jgi:ABC-type lipoprotein release transport system permease subunit
MLGALATSSLLEGMLFRVSSTDPVTFVTLLLLLLGVAVVASWIPSRQATRVAPTEALRTE